MANDNSITIICSNGQKASVNAAIAALYGDPPGSEELSVALSPTGNSPATHWGGNLMLSAAIATAVKDWPNGVVPAPAAAWEDYGLNQASAHAAGQSMIVQLQTGGDASTRGLENFNAMLTSRNLQVVAS